MQAQKMKRFASHTAYPFLKKVDKKCTIGYKNKERKDFFVIECELVQYKVKHERDTIEHTYESYVSKKPLNLHQYACFLNDSLQKETLSKGWLPAQITKKGGKYVCNKKQRFETVVNLNHDAAKAFYTWLYNLMNTTYEELGFPPMTVLREPTTQELNNSSLDFEEQEVWVNGWKSTDKKSFILHKKKEKLVDNTSTSSNRIIYVAFSVIRSTVSEF